jgi:LmbE family N-acetylglucosaminyl deacetylase
MSLHTLDNIDTQHQCIYLSPHFDDAVYSCGGTIALQARQGKNPLITTVFAGIPSSKQFFNLFALRVQRDMGVRFPLWCNPHGIIRVRRNEDGIALAYLQATPLWLSYRDSIYRGLPAYYTTYPALRQKLHPADGWIEEKLTQDLVAVHQRLPHLTWYAPLGIGHHIDHQIVSAAARRLLKHGARVLFYEDFPYVTHESALSERHRELNLPLTPVLVDISSVWQMRLQAAERYRTQVKMNFGSHKALHDLIERYTHSIDAAHGTAVERYWEVQQPL